MVNSQNGWPVNPPRHASLVPGTDIRLVVADGPAGDLLIMFAGMFHRDVESISTGAGGVLDDWGWADRPIRGSDQISNHASATAIDLNATRHPLGATGTFTTKQRDAIHSLLRLFSGAIRWGGDYSGRKDEMHFEINTDVVGVKRALAKLWEIADMATPNEIWSAPVWHHYPDTPIGHDLAESLGNAPGDLVEEHAAGVWLTHVAVRTAVIERQVADMAASLGKLAAVVEDIRTKLAEQ